MQPGEPSVSLRQELGEFLSSRTPGIVEAWLKLVKEDPRLTTPDQLSAPLLKDHVPNLVEALGRSLRKGADAPESDAEATAAAHGTQRWFEGYSIRELLLELYWLRAVLFRYITEFARDRQDGLAICQHSFALVDAFLNDLESRSVEGFTEENAVARGKSKDARLRLIRSVTHELRNMMNSVGLASTLLDVADLGAIHRMRQSLELNIGHMKEVLDDLIGLSSVLSGEARAKPAWFQLPVLLDSVQPRFQSLAEAQGLRFTSAIKGGLLTVYSDEAKIRQIIENLISNAIKYTHQGEVSLTLEAVDENHFAVVVQDTGVGIAKEDRGHIFSDSYHTTIESPLRGSGLGLAIVAGLVDLLKGSIELKSELSQGSTFKVVLPRKHEG